MQEPEYIEGQGPRASVMAAALPSPAVRVECADFGRATNRTNHAVRPAPDGNVIGFGFGRQSSRAAREGGRAATAIRCRATHMRRKAYDGNTFL